MIEAEGVGFAYGDRPIVRDFSTTIQRGDKVGIIGPNGSGKTTLLRLLMGELPPQHGRSAARAPMSRWPISTSSAASWTKAKSVLDNVGEGRDTITINGKPRNLIGYLEDFLFTPDRVHAPISALSGGERNRLLLARLFAHPANLLVLDEPTNDLDIETLEILEDLLLEYTGTLLLVSHDRAFLNNLVTSTLVLDGNGKVEEYVGGYDDWQRQDAQSRQTERAASPEHKPVSRPAEDELQSTGPRKPSYKERRVLETLAAELAGLPQRIEMLETEQQALMVAMAEPGFYQQDSQAIAGAVTRLKALEEELVQAYARWAELEAG